MRILIVSGTFLPRISPRSFRTTELVKELIKSGHEITLYIPYIEYDYTTFLSQYPLKLVQYKDSIDSYINSKSKIKWIFGRILVYTVAYPDIKLLKNIPCKLRKENETYQLLISIAAPHQIHWAIGNMYSRGKKLASTWIADCGDPYMLAKSINRPHPFYFKWIEKRWCEYCDYITVPIKEATDGYYPEFRSKIRVIPQGFSFDDIKLESYKPHQITTFAYSGSFIKNRRDIRPVINKLIDLKLNFRMYIYTNNFSFFEDYKHLIGKQIILSGFIPRLELLKKLSTMDFLLNIENGTTVQTPSKLIDYSLTKRPILSINSNDIDENKIIEFFKRDYTHQTIIDNIEQYNIKNIAQQFIDLCR